MYLVLQLLKLSFTQQTLEGLQWCSQSLGVGRVDTGVLGTESSLPVLGYKVRSPVGASPSPHKSDIQTQSAGECNFQQALQNII